MSPKRTPSPRRPIARTPAIVYVGVAVVLLAVAGLGWWLVKGGHQHGATLAHRSVVGPTGAAEPEANALAVNAHVSGSVIQLTGWYRAKDYALVHATTGNEFVAALFRQPPGNASLFLEAMREATLRAGTTAYQPVSFSLPSGKDSEAHGTLVFEIPTGQSNLVLSLGSTSTIPLTQPAQ